MIGAGDPAAMQRFTADCRAAGLSVRRRLLPAGRLPRRRLDAHPDRGRRVLVLQRVRGGASSSRRPAGPARTSSTGWRRGSSPSAPRAPASSARAPTRSSSARSRTRRSVEPTGSGDAFRSGFLAATAWGLPTERAIQLGQPDGGPRAWRWSARRSTTSPRPPWPTAPSTPTARRQRRKSPRTSRPSARPETASAEYPARRRLSSLCGVFHFSNRPTRASACIASVVRTQTNRPAVVPGSYDSATAGLWTTGPRTVSYGSQGKT